MRSLFAVVLLGMAGVLGLSTPLRAAGLTGVDLTPDLPAPQPVQTPITLAATPTGGENVEYQFRAGYQTATGWNWTVLQDYSSSSLCAWTPTEARTYTLTVWAREHGSPRDYEVYHLLGYRVISALRALTLTASPLSPTAVGVPVRLTATVTAGVNPRFWFRVKGSTATAWTDVQPYAASATCTWTPAAAGSYTLQVLAKEATSANSYDVYTVIGYIVKTAISAVGLAATPAAPIVPGTPVTLTATPTGGATLRYAFRYRIGTAAWTDIQPYGTARTCTWTPTVAGKYTLEVLAQEVGSTQTLCDVYKVLAYTVAVPITAVTLAADPAPLAGVNAVVVHLTATVTGGTTPVYWFRVKRTLDAAWTTVQPYATSPTCTWRPTGAGAYTVQVMVKEQGSAKTYDQYAVRACTVPGQDGAAMVWVPGGTFMMGSPDGVGNAKQRPRHSVTLTGYWLYKYDVTVAQYRAFCAATGRMLPLFPADQGYGYSWAGKTGWDDPALQQHPIVNVTWYDAQAYADWAGVCLPTEAQWEYAACGTPGWNYPWGGTATATDWYNGWDQTKCANYYNSYAAGISTRPVGSFPAGVSWCGAMDMAGLVWQWCADWEGLYSSTPVTNPTGPSTGIFRICRGGAWNRYFDYARSAYRGIESPGDDAISIGFRCVSLAPGP